MPRAFVIHEHSGYGPPHYDLMLQADDALATWQFPRQFTSIGKGERIPCVKIADHRLAYLDYQGPVSAGRGQVRMLDRGSYEIVEQTARRWLIRLKGLALAGQFELTAEAGGKDWVLARLE